MGTSTDAILFYGFHADEGAWIDFVGSGLGWQEKLAVLAGATRPPSAEYDDSTKDAYKAFWDAQSKAVEEERCEIGSHCSGSPRWASSACASGCRPRGRSDPGNLLRMPARVGILKRR